MPEQTRDRILEACQRVIARDGLSRFRMSRVARAAGVSIGLLSYHFGDRDGLLAAALDSVNEGSARRAAASGPLPPRERLGALLAAEYGDEPAIRDGSTAWNELRAAAVFDPAAASALAASTREWQEQVRILIAEASPRVDAAGTALVLTALVEGLSGRWLSGQLSAGAAQAAVADAVDRLLGPP